MYINGSNKYRRYRGRFATLLSRIDFLRRDATRRENQGAETG